MLSHLVFLEIFQITSQIPDYNSGLPLTIETCLHGAIYFDTSQCINIARMCLYLEHSEKHSHDTI